MKDLTEFHQRALSVAVVKMFTGKHFSICDLENIAATMGRKDLLSGTDYQALRTLHCVDWGDMGPELATMTREKCFELLGLPPQTIDVQASTEPATPKAKPAEQATKLRLAFWQRA